MKDGWVLNISKKFSYSTEEERLDILNKKKER